MSDAPPGKNDRTQERTFAFVDLAGFTALTDVHGDEQAIAQVDNFVAAARVALAEEGGDLVKCIGDAVMLAFDEPVTAMRAVRSLLSACQHLDQLPPTRVGLHHGPAIERDGDWFGGAVNTAARVAAQAAGGQTLATEPVAKHARTIGVRPVGLGSFQLRNLADALEIFELPLTAPAAATSVDPVCRMTVRHDQAASRLRIDGQDEWFCSLDCARRFLATLAHPDGGTT